MTGSGIFDRDNHPVWSWDHGTSTVTSAGYTSYRSDLSMELQWQNSVLKSDLSKLRTELKHARNECVQARTFSAETNAACLTEIEHLHAELETLRRALAEALK